MRKIKGWWVGLLLAMVLILIPTVPALASSSQNVVVTATPAYISISNSPGSWIPNGIVGDGKSPKGTILPSGTYYANPSGDNITPASPVVDGDCEFTLTNACTVNITLTVNFPNFANGDAMANVNQVSGDTATSPTTIKFVAWSYCTGMTTYTTDKVLAKAAQSSAMKSKLATGNNLHWGLELQTQTDDWTSGTAMNSTVVITAVINMA